MGSNYRRAVVSEDAYGVTARVSDTDENGEPLFRSDKLGTAMVIANRVKQCGRACEIRESDGAMMVAIDLGDAPESEFEEDAGALIAAVG